MKVVKQIVIVLVAVVALTCALLPARPATAGGSAPTYFALTSVATGGCLAPATGTVSVGTLVIVEPCNNSDLSQLWWMSGSLLVWSQASLCVDAGATVSNGAPVALNTCSSSSSQQQWSRTPVNGNSNPPRLWSVDGAWCMQPRSDSVVASYACTTLPPQWWMGGT